MRRALSILPGLGLAGCVIAPPPVETTGGDPGPPQTSANPDVVDEQPGPDEQDEPDEPAAVVATAGLYRLRVDTGSSQANEASGFVVFIDETTPVLFTALSAFGPEGGMTTQVPAGGLGSLTVTLEDGLSEPGTSPVLGEASAIENLDCAPYQQGSTLGDVAAFRLPEGFAGTAFEFADEPPKLGTTVTLFAPLPNLPQPRTTAKVLGVEDGLLMLEHSTTDLDMLGAVGAPVLDADGKVVGVYVLGGLDSDVLYGVVTPVQNFRAAISAAATSGS